jgi:LPS sulfotransferase NodH
MAAFYFSAQVVRYITLFVERSGSTYLATALATHPNIQARREEFASLLQQGKNAQEQLNWAEEFYSPPLIGRYKAYGFKTKTMDIIDPPKFASLLRRKNVHVIQLQRRNTVKAVISTINARRLHQASGTWNLLNESDRQPAFEVDLDEFDRLLKERETWDRELGEYVHALNLPTLPLFYEELLQDENAFLAKIFSFLKAPPRPLKAKTLKNTRDNLSEVILNLDALKDKYAGTVYATMFDEVLV